MNRRIYFLSSFIVTVMLSMSHMLFAQKVDIPIDGKRIFDTVSYLSSDQFLGRQPNSPEFFQLQEWIVDQFEEWNLEPAGENGSFFQDVPISNDYAVTYGTPKMIINDREFYSRYEDFIIDIRSSSGIRIKENIIFAGYGISAPDKGLDEYAGIDVEDKFVFVLKGNPDDYTPPPPRLGRQEDQEDTPESVDLDYWQTESLDSMKIMTAYNKGAAGMILYNPEKESNPFRRFRSTVEESPFERDFIVVSESSEQIFYWIFWTDPQMSSRGFRTWFDGIRTDIKNKKARSFDTKIKAEISGFENTLLKGGAFNDSTGRNILAKITGSDPVLKNQYVVIGAHLDHVGVLNGQIYNGAEDNASGSGVVFELAHLMKTHRIQTKRTIIFCLWTAEEKGLIGSRHWVNNPSDEVNMDQVVTYFNLDMVGLGDTIDAPGALNFQPIWDVIIRDQDADIMAVVVPDIGGPGGSDQTPFIELGIESLALMTGGDGGHPDYHDTGDDGYKLDPEIMRKTAKFVLQGAVNIGNETEVQLLIPDRERIFAGLYWPVTCINPKTGSKDGWTWLEAKTYDELTQSMTLKINELKNPDPNEDPFRAMRRRYRIIPRNTGLSGTQMVNHDVNVMRIAKDILNFGRIDIMGDDSIWFNHGLTQEGNEALKVMQRKDIVLHLINPSAETLEDVLNKTQKSFMISGFSEFTPGMIENIKKHKVLVTVDFNPEDVENCFNKLEFYKTKFDTTANLFLNIVSEIGLDSAKQDLYTLLNNNGWSKQEIYAIGGAGSSWRSKGNLDVLPGDRPRFPRRR